MAERSLRTSQAGIARAENALTDKGWSRQDLADRVVIEGKKTTTGISIQTIHKFLTGEKVDRKYFVGICKALDLPWNEIEESAKQPKPECPQPKQGKESDIDALVREVRERIQPYIQEKCGTMRVLDMSQPIGLGEIYTNVNILEKLTGRRGLELAELMRDTSPEKFERFCLGDVREQRVPGLEAVETFSKLMILGKPGAGKTTFLKHLAIQCIGGVFQGDRVPVFITLKDFAEAPKQPDLLEYIDRVVPMPFDPSPTPPRRGEGLSDSPFPASEGGRRVRSSVSIREILKRGRTLILLDGLDEVRDADSSRVLRQIQEFSQHFSQNQFVITCRIAAREYTFEQFSEVEIADFDDDQIADFSSKWFRSKNDPIKAEHFLQKLEEDAPIRELATNPLLLTLLCLVFEDSGSFPSNRAELYETGVDVLLKKWDVKRNIERDQVYKRLSLKRKEDLLSQIARTTFEAGNYFFKQREVERYITQYIQNLPDASTDPEALELDSAAVLKAIEAQHGLFVERARGIYSFSHLTFHEYFTARKIKESCNPYAVDDPTLQGLVSHLTEKRWREVFLLTVGMLDSADALLGLMKIQTDSLLEEEDKLQHFLYWLNQKSSSIQTSFKLAAIRFFYLALSCNKSIAYIPSDDYKPLLKYSLLIDRILDIDFSVIVVDHALDHALRLAINLNESPKEYFEEDKLFSIAPDSAICFDINVAYLHAPIIKQALPKLEEQLWSSYENKIISPAFKKWWNENGQAWTDQLKAVTIKHRNIGHDWQFSDEQKKLLQQYYDANKLLVDCLNSDCYVSREVRQEIEETLLLPIAEIEKRKQLNR
jgi:predicted NACHT family NTPase